MMGGVGGHQGGLTHQSAVRDMFVRGATSRETRGCPLPACLRGYRRAGPCHRRDRDHCRNVLRRHSLARRVRYRLTAYVP